jgi:hypothetical protein
VLSLSLVWMGSGTAIATPIMNNFLPFIYPFHTRTLFKRNSTSFLIVTGLIKVTTLPAAKCSYQEFSQCCITDTVK